jgi:hypothetical protein
VAVIVWRERWKKYLEEDEERKRESHNQELKKFDIAVNNNLCNKANYEIEMKEAE